MILSRLSTYKHLPFFKDMPPTIHTSHCDTTQILSELLKLTMEDWELYRYMRVAKDMPNVIHTSTYTIPVVWTMVSSDPRQPMKRVTFPRFSKFASYTHAN